MNMGAQATKAHSEDDTEHKLYVFEREENIQDEQASSWLGAVACGDERAASQICGCCEQHGSEPVLLQRPPAGMWETRRVERLEKSQSGQTTWNAR